MVASYYTQAYCETSDALSYGSAAMNRHLLRINYGIVKLYLMSNCALDTMEWNSHTLLFMFAMMSKPKVRAKTK